MSLRNTYKVSRSWRSIASNHSSVDHQFLELILEQTIVPQAIVGTMLHRPVQHRSHYCLWHDRLLKNQFKKLVIHRAVITGDTAP